jgi:CBS domain-containing protein
MAGGQEARMTIADILSTKGSAVATVPVGTLVRDVVGLLAEQRIGAVPVLGSDGTIRGIFSERDLVARIAVHGHDALDAPVEHAMNSPAVTVDSGTPILAALSIMTNRRMRHLPVVESGQIRGIVSIGDLVKHRIERIEAEAEALRTYIQTA